jgi:hypothetical protein
MSMSILLLEGFGTLEFRGQLHSGSSDLLEVGFGGRTLLLKVPGEGEPSAGSFFARQSIVFTRQFSSIARSGEPAAPLSPEEVLQLEAERVHQSGGAWGHHVLWGGRVRGRSGEPYGLLLPWHEGRALRELSREEKRRLLPRQLPWLWDALSAAPHGDLHEGNLLVSPSGGLVLIDPGVLHFRHHAQSGDSVSECTFTTNPEHYPLLPPYYLPSAPLAQVDGLSAHFHRLREGLAGVVQLGELTFAGGPSPLLARLPGPRDEPGPADLMALGVLYYRALTGQHPLYDDRFTRPAWLGGRCFESHREHDTGFEAALERLSRPRTAPQGVTPAEAALCQALLELRVGSRAQLLTLCDACWVAAGIGPRR